MPARVAEKNLWFVVLMFLVMAHVTCTVDTERAERLGGCAKDAERTEGYRVTASAVPEKVPVYLSGAW